jgi:hypothetical protein
VSRIWLIGVAVFVIALVVAGIVAAVVTDRGDADLLPIDSPEGIAQRFLLAMRDERYQEAYDYLASHLQERCSYDDFLRFASFREIREGHVTLEDTKILDNTARVRVRVTVFEPNVPLPSEYSYDRTYNLKLEDGQWRVTRPEWWCPPPRPF